MNTNIKRLLDVPAIDWVVERVLADDWYDGPISGVCQLSYPVCQFAFKEVDFDRDEDDDLIHTYRVFEVPNDTLERMWKVCLAIDKPRLPVWIPSYAPEQPGYALVAKEFERLDQIKRPTRIHFRSRNMYSFKTAWEAIDASDDY